MARGEANEFSDLDLFIVDELSDDKPALSFVESSRLVAALDNVRADAKFRDFSRGGDFIRKMSLKQIHELIGDPRDDATNAFTARILLLINSQCLLNDSAYSAARGGTIDRYWDGRDQSADFRPIMLVNDLKRWWGVLCLNFERFTPVSDPSDGKGRENPDRKIANLKLRYARSLAVFSVLWGLLDESTPEGLVSRSGLEEVLNRTPVRRMMAIAERAGDGSRAAEQVHRLLLAYDKYLSFMHKDKESLIEAVEDREIWEAVKNEAYSFHQNLAAFTRIVGTNKSLLDYVLV